MRRVYACPNKRSPPNRQSADWSYIAVLKSRFAPAYVKHVVSLIICGESLMVLRSPPKSTRKPKPAKCSLGCVLLGGLVIISAWVSIVFYYYRVSQKVSIPVQRESDSTSLPVHNVQPSKLMKVESKVEEKQRKKGEGKDDDDDIGEKPVDKEISGTDIGDKDLGEKPVSDGGENLHIVFSTDCTFFQDWQTLLVFHSAKLIGQVRNPCIHTLLNIATCLVNSYVFTARSFSPA